MRISDITRIRIIGPEGVFLLLSTVEQNCIDTITKKEQTKARAKAKELTAKLELSNHERKAEGLAKALKKALKGRGKKMRAVRGADYR